MEQKTDLRIVKTKKAIRKAFFKLIKTKDVQSITIKEIAEVAQIDRKTFYAHYSAIYELVDELENEAIQLVSDLVYDIDAYDFFTNPSEMISVLQTITENPSFSFLRYLCVKDNTNLINKFKSAIKARMANEFKSVINLDDTTLFLLVDYTVAGITTCYQSWLKAQKPMPMNRLCEEISEIAVLGLSGFVNR
jgi:AcrR family transcriptional regulator